MNNRQRQEKAEEKKKLDLLIESYRDNHPYHYDYYDYAEAPGKPSTLTPWHARYRWVEFLKKFAVRSAMRLRDIF